uniref:Piwi domain-containing protein n=1 Tax=Heterorhabditis bacteriophora TaxID=37862 RepID=A0A1I7XQJ6_HETBA
MIDAFTKYPVIEPLPDQKARTTLAAPVDRLSAATQNSSFYVTYGRQPNSPFTNKVKVPMRIYQDEDDYITQLTENLKTAWNFNTTTISNAQARQKKHYDVRNHARASDFKIGNKTVIR